MDDDITTQHSVSPINICMGDIWIVLFCFFKSRGFFFFQGRDPASLAPYKEAYRLEAAAEEYSEGGRPGGRPGGAPGKPPKPERLGGKALVFAAAAAAAAAAA